jgi:hypothetical protein
MSTHKIALWVEDGVVQGVRASLDVSVEVIDLTTGGKRDAESKWDKYQTEFPFSIY